MEIDKETAETRLNDPNNILNKLFSGTSRNNRVVDTTPVDTTPTDTPVDIPIEGELVEPENSSEGNTTEFESEDETSSPPADSTEAIQYLLGLRKAKADPLATPGSKVVKHNRHGKTEGALNIPEPTRELIGTLSALGTQTATAKAFGISNAAAHLAEHGKGGDGKARRARIEENIGKVVDKALDKLLCTIDNMGEDQLGSLPIKEAAAVASQMSKVVANLNKREDDAGRGVAAQLIVYAPTQVTEERYEVIEVGANK